MARISSSVWSSKRASSQDCKTSGTLAARGFGQCGLFAQAFAVFDQIRQTGGEQRVLGLSLAQLFEHLDEVNAVDGALRVASDGAVPGL